MKKLYNSNKGAKRIHPSPLPPPSSSSSSSSFSFTHIAALPTALLALASALSAEEQEVLAYLLGCEKSKEKQRKKSKNHPPELGCSCFGCYKSFWARWDSSPNRHVIHTIIDAFEENLESNEILKMKGKSRRKRSLKKKDEVVVKEMDVVEKRDDGHDGGDDDVYGDDGEEEVGEEEEEKSSVRKFLSWVFGDNN